MRSPSCSTLISMLCLVGFAAEPASASPIRLSFTGHITTVFDPAGLAGTDVVAGTAFAATIAYDPAALSGGTVPLLDGTLVAYGAPIPPASIELLIGPWTIGTNPFFPNDVNQGDGFGIVVGDRVPSSPDQDGIRWSTNVTEIDGLAAPPIYFGFAALGLFGDADTIHSTSLIDVPLDLATWGLTEFQLDVFFLPNDDEIMLIGTITSLSVTALAEPGTSLVLGSMLAARVARRRRPTRRHSA